MANNMRQILEERFHAHVVDERRVVADGRQLIRLLVQFPTDTEIQTFQAELRRMAAGQTTGGILKPGMRRNLFYGLQRLDVPSREDRVGSRLHAEGFPAPEPFYLDVDLWHPGDVQGARDLMDQLREFCSTRGGRVAEDLRTASLLLAKVAGSRALAEALLDWDVVARVDLPPRFEQWQERVLVVEQPPPVDTMPPDDAPLVCVVDSGVVAGHPLLINWVIDERDFDTGEQTVVDRNGHGTAVAGIAAYGNIAHCLTTRNWQPKVRICSAKVLRNLENPANPDADVPAFPDEHRVERVVEDAIRHFHQTRGCRIFNLSLGSRWETYQGGRQFPWAENLDELARELDIVIVVAAGNHLSLAIPDTPVTRDQFQKAVRDQLMTSDHRVTNPATAALALTVGAIARSDALGPQLGQSGRAFQDALPGAPAGAPAPFTRTGPGYAVDEGNTGIKPDLVDYGGNAALHTLAAGQPRWAMSHVNLGEPSLHVQRGLLVPRQLGARSGTSFACPHVSHIAALGLARLTTVLARPPTANLVRALVGSAAHRPPYPTDWLPDEKAALQLTGYGLSAVVDVEWSRPNRVTLVAEDTLGEDQLHLYRLPVPQAFLDARGSRGITVALAFDPPVRASRRQYLARTMWVELLHGLTTAQVAAFRARRPQGTLVPEIPSGAKLALRPTKSMVEWSTLQVCQISWSQRPTLRPEQGEEEPMLHVLVGCQKRFPTDAEPVQGYGLVVTVWHELAHVDLYQALRSRVRVPARRVRITASLGDGHAS